MSEPVPSPKRLWARAEAETHVIAGCYNCGATWNGAEARALASAHRDLNKHMVWVERQPE